MSDLLLCFASPPGESEKVVSLIFFVDEDESGQAPITNYILICSTGRCLLSFIAKITGLGMWNERERGRQLFALLVRLNFPGICSILAHKPGTSMVWLV